MKHTHTRVLSVLLAFILLLGIMPVGVLAGGSVERIPEAKVFIHFPMGGEHPNMAAQLVGPANYTVDFVHFFNCYAGEPDGAFLDEDYIYTAGRYYACQVHLIPKDGFEFTEDSEILINGRYPDPCEVYPDGSVYATVFFTAAARTVTVTFDTCGHGTPHAPVEVPNGGTLADAVPDVTTLDPPDQDYELFVMWALDPLCTTYSYNAFSYSSDPITEPITLYAHWALCEQSVDLYVQVPNNCLDEESVLGKPTVTVPDRADYSVEPDYFYYGITDGYLHYDLVNMNYLAKGGTYYSQVKVNTALAGKLPKVNLYGGKVISTTRIDDYSFNIIYSITVPSGSSLTKAGVYIETPKAGSSDNPVVTSLTPGIEMSVWGWYTSQNVSGDWYEGTLEGGKTYFALVRINGSVNYNIAYNTLNLDVYGRNASLVRMVDLASAEGVPNFAGAVISVTIPKQHILAAEVPYGGGKIRCKGETPNWVATMDFTVEEGPITLEAKPDSEHLFKMWYDAKTFKRLSKDAVYSFNLDHDVHICAEFVARPPFEDVGAWDYYYEPVMWAIHHDPVITGGTDSTHFSPKQACTREQIVTFLWKANGAPTPSATEIPFSDVKPGKYYTKAVLWAVENGITGGVGGGKFGVGQTCTREQAMTCLWKAKGSPSPSSDNNPFTDVKAGKYYYKAILWAVNRVPQVTGGVGGGQFGVGQTCTRAQIITFLSKVYGPVG